MLSRLRFRQANRLRRRTLAETARCAILLGALSVAAAPAAAQQTPAPDADPADVESIDAIIDALYDVISGPAGERDWDRFRSLFLPGAAELIPAATPPSARSDRPLPVLSPQDYVDWGGPYFLENPFYEREVARDEERFGNIAQLFSTYESRRSPEDAEPFARGINSVQLVRHDGRWWIVSIAWDEDRPGNPIPAEYEARGG